MRSDRHIAKRSCGRSAVAMRPLNESLPLKLLIAREAVMDRFRPHLHSAGVTEQQWRVLRALCETEEMEAGELAQAICLKMPSLSRIIADLSGRGLISKRNGINDKRLRLVSITHEGRALFDQMSKQSEQEYADIQRTMGSQAYSKLMAELDSLIEELKP